jgi:CRISPR-associated protein (TIGR03984 family)
MNGLNLAKKIGLQICECQSNFLPVTCEISLNDVEKTLNDKFKNSRAVFVAWQIQNIVWGKFENGKIFSIAEITPQYWLECRIFNETEELHLKRIKNKLCGRYVEDTKGTGNFYVDSFSRFWGENFGTSDGFIKLLDRQRKLFMEVPCAEKNSNWYGLLTRNYISSDEKTGLSGYTDYRFVAIEPAKEGGLNG